MRQEWCHIFYVTKSGVLRKYNFSISKERKAMEEKIIEMLAGETCEEKI